MPELPKGQDVMADQPLLLAWQSGPLPDQSLEQIAWELFRFRYPHVTFDNALCKRERDECRALAIRLAVKFIQRDRWTLTTAVDRLTDESCRLCYGDRRLGSTLRQQVRDFAESYLEDLAKLFPRKLFYPRDVERNAAEIEAEDAS